ncbi:MAG: hypothetical protein WA985_09875 [Erythrobacter sp.]
MTSINAILTNKFNRVGTAIAFAAMLPACVGTASAQPGAQAGGPSAVPAGMQGSVPDRGSEGASGATLADLVTLSEAADLVIRAVITDQIALDAERAPDVAPGFVRLYVEAETLALIAGSAPVGQGLAYLLDVPLTSRGRAPDLEDREVVLFAKAVEGRPGSIQLVSPRAQLDHSPTLETRLRPILTELVGPDRPPRVEGVKDAFAVPGTLTGESETQIFLRTEGTSPVSIAVLRRPGQPPSWGVSWGEIVDSSARPPQRDTVRWYRLACSLPETLPESANLAREPEARALASRDYAFVREALGDCPRALTQGD